MPIAVLTGDLVASTDMTPTRFSGALTAIRDSAGDLGALGANVRHASYRGDGWQIAIDLPHLWLRTGLLIRAALKTVDEALDTRIAIASDDTDLPERIETARSPAFIASGRLLDSLKAPVRMDHAAGGERRATALLADHLSQGWTGAQAHALLPYLVHMRPPTQTAVAADLGITQQSVAQALDSAGYRHLRIALLAVEDGKV